MKPYRFLLFLAGILALVALACNAGSAPTEEPEKEPPTPVVIVVTATPEKPAPEPTAESVPSTNEQGGVSSDLVTFTDSNNLFSFEIPGDWNYSNSFNEEEGIYVDHFESPDQTGFIENIAGFSNVSLTGNSNGKIALYFIHKYYSNTGKEGDIRVTGDQLQPDGSERLEWKSKGGGYSGLSFFEVRGSDRKTFLMFTLWWSDATPDDVLETMNYAIESYRAP